MSARIAADPDLGKFDLLAGHIPYDPSHGNWQTFEHTAKAFSMGSCARVRRGNFRTGGAVLLPWPF
jgi:hypothetical protein